MTLFFYVCFFDRLKMIILYFAFFTLAVFIFLIWWAAAVNSTAPTYQPAAVSPDQRMILDEGSPGAAERSIDLLYGGKLV